ncbi:hypothetical protein XCR_3193 [Xanthomonas campestris pv. raphani 756C]|nr:hypothetical protein XCR_3193 [Xanthomonas campestris pv. raphani 756C]
MTPCVLLSAARATACRCRYAVVQHGATQCCVAQLRPFTCRAALKHSTEHR